MKPTPMLQKGLELHRSGQLRDAESVYRQVLRRWPRQSDALYLLGLVVQQDGNHQEAVVLFTQSATVNPSQAAAYLQKGFSLNALGRAEEAATAFGTAITRQANLSEAHHQLGNTLRALKRLPEAIDSLREATRLAPSDAVMWLSRGVACMESQLQDEAIESFQQAVRLDGKLPEAREILGQALLAQHRTNEARQQLQEALRLRPGFTDAQHDLGRTCALEGLLDEAVGYYRAALAARPEAETHSNLLFVQNYLPHISPETHFAEHRLWQERFGAPLRNDWKPHRNDPAPNRRLRVGYISPDFREHAVMALLEPVLRAHHRSDFEVFCYANVKKPDAVTQRLQAEADQWRDIHGMEPERVAELIRQDGIDILMDLAGHTTGNQLLALARKPAPVQATWLGYPNTTGLDAIDYRITDDVSDPPGQTECWQSEKLERLPETFFCFHPLAGEVEAGPLPALATGRITFGCLNNFCKVSDPTIKLWAQLLRQLPESRLLLESRLFTASPDLDQDQAAQRFLEKFARAGVAPERIELNRTRLPIAQHINLYNRIDIALDPFPYNGGVTTCEALWMGVPVVTLAGRTYVARAGASAVVHLGFPDWAPETPEAYLAKCVELAGDLGKLAQLRGQLREKMRQSPLCDAPRFVGHFERALRQMWARWCQQQNSLASR